jgi:hypothetical protein
LAIDTLVFDFEVIPTGSTEIDVNKPPANGCYVYGLFLDGARWDEDAMYLAEPLPKILSYTMPYIWLIPKTVEEIDEEKHVRVPLANLWLIICVGIQLPSVQNIEESWFIVDYWTFNELRVEHQTSDCRRTFT